MITLNSDLTRGLDVFNRQIADQGFNQASNSVRQTSSETVQFGQNQQQSFTFFYRSVHSKLEQSLGAKSSKLEQDIAEQQLAKQNERAEAASGNILGFIERQLKRDVNDGASKEQLESRLNAALEGFEQGYSEANDVLKELNLLSPDLESEIGLTKEKVMAGIEQLKSDYLEQKPSTDATEPENTDSEQQGPSSSSTSTAIAGQQSAGIANDFSFELTTADGDRVKINASALMAQSSSYGAYSGSANGNQVQMAYLSQASYKESNFGFSVEGELDEKELKAINNLLNQVNDLASDFYQGDVAKAFDKALEMNYDSSEISEFSISLTQVKNFTAYQAYQTDKPIFNPNTVNQLKPLADFTRDLVNTSKQIEQLFSEPKQLMSSVIDQLSQLQQPMDYPTDKPSFGEFATRLLDTFNQQLNQTKTDKE